MPEHSIAKRCRAIHDFKAVVRWRSLANVLHADPRTFPTPSGEQHFAIIESTAPTTGPHRGANDGVKENCLNGTKFKIPVITSSPVRTFSSTFGCRSGFGAHSVLCGSRELAMFAAVRRASSYHGALSGSVYQLVVL